MKNMKKLAVCLLFAFILASCPNDPDNSNSSINIVKVDAKELRATDEIDLTARAVAAGANDFAFRLSAALVKNTGDKNFVCSPYSVWLPLAALVNATNSQNKAALKEALGAAGIDEADINKAASRMLYDLTKLQNKRYEGMENFEYYNPLQIANAIFVDKKVTLRKDFAQTFMDFYRGASINVDFSSKDAVDAVNNWASENTKGLIKNLIQEFDPRTVAAIANAIYFSDRWSWEFNSSQTKQDVFYAPAGKKTAFYMLREGSDQTYYEDEKVQALPLRFRNDGGMYIILPKDGTAGVLLSSMTNEYFDEIKKGSFPAEGKLLLPRFSIESDIGLKKTLELLGVPLFGNDPITGLIEGKVPLSITDAKQRAVIQVDEKGTTAAAVTYLLLATSAGPQPNKPFEMICDKPFVFILYENTHDGGAQILFTGIVNEP